MTDIKETIERLPDAYDAGLLGGTHLRNSDWWHDYIRAELGHAHDHYVQQAEALITAFKELEVERDRLREALEAVVDLERAPEPEDDEYGFSSCNVEGFNTALSLAESIALKALEPKP